MCDFFIRLLFVLCTIYSSLGFANDSQNMRRQLSVSGTAILKKPADQLKIDIGIVTQDENAQKALQKNSEQASAVMDALQKAGLSQKEFQTGNFTIRPLYSHPPKNTPPDWVAKINGYEVRNTITVTTDQMKSVGKLIDAANAAGANSIDNFQFDLKDPRIYRAEAIQVATTHAKNDAETLATAANLKLVKILQIALDHSTIHPLRANSGEMHFLRAKAFDAAPPIEPGDVSVKAEVSILYEIE